MITELELIKHAVERTHGFGCTAFTLRDDDRYIVGRNFDFLFGDGHLITNNKNIRKEALLPASEKKLTWVSKYGSVTFNQMGREFPFGGLNEEGFVLEQLWLDSTVYPERDERFGLSVLQWIQYQLDSSKSIENLIESDKYIRIVPESEATLHFFACDRYGNSAVVEFINGELVIHKESDLTVPVLTNHTYQDSISHMNNRNGHEENNLPFTANSLLRFETTAQLLSEFDDDTHDRDGIDCAFEILDRVSQPERTKWTIVYDLEELVIHFKTSDASNIRTLSLSEINFMDATNSFINLTDGDCTSFQQYTTEENTLLINRMFDKLSMLSRIPGSVRDATVEYPSTTINENIL